MTLEEEAALPAQVRWEGRFIQAITQGRWEYVARARGIQAQQTACYLLRAACCLPGCSNQ